MKAVSCWEEQPVNSIILALFKLFYLEPPHAAIVPFASLTKKEVFSIFPQTANSFFITDAIFLARQGVNFNWSSFSSFSCYVGGGKNTWT